MAYCSPEAIITLKIPEILPKIETNVSDTTFTDACVDGNLQLLTQWTEEGETMKRTVPYDLGFMSNDGFTEILQCTPLFILTHQNHIDCVKLLLEKSDVDVNYIEKAKQLGGNSILSVAAAKGHLEICKLLLDHGAFIDVRNKKNQSALIHAILNKHTDIVRLFCERGCNMNQEDFNEQLPLTYAASQNVPEIVEILLQHGADPKLNTVQKTNAVLNSLCLDSLDTFKVLINFVRDNYDEVTVADIANQVTPAGGTALGIVAVSQDKEEALEMLLDAGADPNLPTVRYTRRRLQINCCGNTAHTPEPQHTDSCIAKSRLAEADPMFHSSTYGRFPSCYDTSSRSPLQQGEKRSLPLTHAIIKGSVEAVRLLLPPVTSPHAIAENPIWLDLPAMFFRGSVLSSGTCQSAVKPNDAIQRLEMFIDTGVGLNDVIDEAHQSRHYDHWQPTVALSWSQGNETLYHLYSGIYPTTFMILNRCPDVIVKAMLRNGGKVTDDDCIPVQLLSMNTKMRCALYENGVSPNVYHPAFAFNLGILSCFDSTFRSGFKIDRLMTFLKYGGECRSCFIPIPGAAPNYTFEMIMTRNLRDRHSPHHIKPDELVQAVLLMMAFITSPGVDNCQWLLDLVRHPALKSGLTRVLTTPPTLMHCCRTSILRSLPNSVKGDEKLVQVLKDLELSKPAIDYVTFVNATKLHQMQAAAKAEEN